MDNRDYSGAIITVIFKDSRFLKSGLKNNVHR